MTPSPGPPAVPSPSAPTAGIGWPAAVLLYLLLASLVTLPGLGSATLIKMEGMVADVSEAMLETSDYVVPRLYGEVYTYKPPLVYWLTAASLRLAGDGAGALRLPAALSPLLMGLVVLWLTGRIGRPRLGLWTGIAAITGTMFFSKTKLAEFDAVLASAVGIAIAAACHNLAQRRRPHWLFWCLCYGALAAGLLAKGVPALMAFGPGLLAAALFTRRWRRLLDWRHWIAAGLGAALVAAWLWLLWQAEEPTALQQPLWEARARGLEWSLAALGRTLVKPLTIAAGFLPWSLAWPWAVADLRKPSSTRETEPSELLARAATGFLFAGTVTFMAVPTHEPRYYLPLAAPAAIVASTAIERRAWNSQLAFRLAAGLVALCGGLLLLAAVPGLLDAPTAGQRFGLPALGISAIASTRLLARRSPRHRLAGTLLLGALCVWAAETWALRPARARARDLRPLARELDAAIPEEATIWSFGAASEVGKYGALYYYLDRPVRAFRLADRGPGTSDILILPGAAEAEMRGELPELVRRLAPLAEGRYRDESFRVYRLAPAAVDDGVAGREDV